MIARRAWCAWCWTVAAVMAAACAGTARKSDDTSDRDVLRPDSAEVDGSSTIDDVRPDPTWPDLEVDAHAPPDVDAWLDADAPPPDPTDVPDAGPESPGDAASDPGVPDLDTAPFEGIDGDGVAPDAYDAGGSTVLRSVMVVPAGGTSASAHHAVTFRLVPAPAPGPSASPHYRCLGFTTTAN